MTLNDLRNAVAEVKDAAQKAQERITVREQGMAEQIRALQLENAQLKTGAVEPQLVSDLHQALGQVADLLGKL